MGGDREKMKSKWVFLSVLFLILSCISVVSAHSLHVVYKLNEIEIEACFADGTPVRDAEVTVYDKGGNLYMKGTTDEEGKFRFPLKVGVNDYTVVVNATHTTHISGYKGETRINLSQAGIGADEPGMEMSLYARIVAGFGYLSGVAGAAMIYMGWKQKKRYDRGEKN